MITFVGGKIWRNGAFSANTQFEICTDNKDKRIIHLDEDDLITPGLVDFHAHLWSPASISPFGIDDGRLFSQGIVAVGEPGSFGADNWQLADRYWCTAGRPKIRSFMHILPQGLASFPPQAAPRPEEIDVTHVIEMAVAAQSTSRLLGVKIHLGWLPYKDVETDRGFLEIARRVADACNTRMMVHISGECVTAPETFAMMKKGDVITHIYSGLQNNILNKDGKVFPEVIAAQERGVIFDIGASSKHFSWEVFNKARTQGINFRLMGSDVTLNSWNNYTGRGGYHLYYFLSAMLSAGISLNEAFTALIDEPASLLELDVSKLNSCLVLKKRAQSFDYAEGLGNVQHSNFVYLPFLFEQDGRVILDSTC